MKSACMMENIMMSKHKSLSAFLSVVQYRNPYREHKTIGRQYDGATLSMNKTTRR